jgi:import inner membrane translocase subunit TIM23
MTDKSKQQQQEEFDGYVSKPIDFSQIPGLSSQPVNPALVAPIFGVPTQLPGPEYLEYNITGRTWAERMFYNTGTMYLIGIVLGGSFGFVEGFRTAPSTKFNIRLNSILNRSGRRGSRLGNALGSVSFLYSLIEGASEYSRVDRYIPRGYGEYVTPIVTATLTGVIYKSTQGPKTMAVAGGIGAVLASTSVLAKTFLPPRSGSSKGLLFF